MISALLSRVISLTLGTLYPAYASYKAVRTKNVKEYVRWMMYWIVFALFNSVETFADVFLAFWFPFYYELKICTLIWLLAPATNGSSLLYKQFVHPMLMRREKEIDALLEEARSRGYTTCVQLGGRGARYVTSLLMEGVLRAPTVMAELVQTGQLAIETRRFEDVTAQTQSGPSSAGMDIDMSDNEAPAQSAVSESDFNLESEVEEKEDSENKTSTTPENEGDVKTRKARKSKKTTSTVDLALSSGDEGDDPDFKVPQQKKTARKSSRKTRSTK